MFFSRDKFVKPGENLFGSDPPAYYTKEDCYIGAVLELRDFKFLLTDADEYALRYMELNCSEVSLNLDCNILQLASIYFQLLAHCTQSCKNKIKLKIEILGKLFVWACGLSR